MSKVNFVPMHGAVLVELPEVEETTKSGIIKSDDMLTQERSQHDGFLKVVSSSAESDVVEGMHVMANLMQCSMVDIDEVKYGLIPKHAILGYKPN
tara:strand:+ start:187 stop:471 length:285 start_codon:yes stop_codon:yes gene_type:complete